MGSRARAAASVLVAWALIGTALLFAPPAASAEGVHVEGGTLPLRCSWFRSVNVSVDWYRPHAEPKGLVYVQHGFLGSKSQMSDVALSLSNAGYLVLVPTLSSFSPTCGVRSEGLLTNLADAFTDGRVRQSYQQAYGTSERLPTRGAVVGHSIGAAAVTFVAAQPSLEGLVGLVVHLDAVETPNGLLHAALRESSDLRILQLTAPASPLNADNSGPGVVATFGRSGTFAAHGGRAIDGALVVAGTHCDPLGDFPFNVCGSNPSNQAAFFALTVAGVDDAVGKEDVSAAAFLETVEELGELVQVTP